MSAEVIQEQQASDEDAEGNPEVDVGGDYTKQIAGDWAGDWEFRQFNNLV